MNPEHADQNGHATGEPTDATRTETGAPPVADDGLVSRLTVIEDQPLEARAAAYTQLHDQLRDRLEGGDVPRSTKA
jgi:hypothetical protein